VGIAREAKKAVKQFATSTGMDKRRAAAELQAIAVVAARHGLSEGDTFRVGADSAKMLDTFADHEGTRDLLASGWQSGSLTTMGGLPMREHAPLEGVLGVADAVCAQFFSDEWAEYATGDRDRTIRLLQEEHAMLAAVPMSSTAARIAELEQALADLGAKPDPQLIQQARDEGL
jgi:hypothetical protein